MELDTIIKDLNAKLTMHDVSLEELSFHNLTEVEKTFIKKYSPVNSFIIYGTLAPNKPNHSKIEHIKGTYLKGVVKGKLVKEGWGAELGYYGFKPSQEQEETEASILISNELIENWSFLDQFEGEEYKRILAKYELDNGEVGVGSIYAIKH